MEKKNVFYEKELNNKQIKKWFKRKHFMYKDYYNFTIEGFNKEEEVFDLEDVEYWRMLLKKIILIYNFTQEKLFYRVQFEKLCFCEEDKIWRQKD